MEHSELIQRFINDLQIQDCIVQVGTAQKVTNELTPANLDKCLMNLRGLDAFFLAGVRAGTVGRAADRDVIYKNSFFIDFDIRELWKKDYGENISDGEIKEISTGVIHSLNTHDTFRNWRYVVFSGNGIHIHYFGNPVRVDSPEKWKIGMQALLTTVEDLVKIRPDYSCTNTGRMARLPGSENCKHYRRVLVEILEYQEGAIFDIGFINKASEVKIEQQRKQTVEQINVNGIAEGMRNTTLTSLAGSLRHRGLNEATILDALKSVNAKECKPPLSENEVLQITHSVMKYEPRKIKEKNHQSVTGRCLSVTKASDVEPEPIEWLWNSRIALGKVALLVGNPGQGKSYASCGIAAAVTLGGTLPGHTGNVLQGDVLMCAIEDGLADTIRPRLDVVGADPAKVHVVTGIVEDGKEENISLETDIGLIEEYLKSGDYKLIILDPINAYLGKNTDSYKDADIRSVLTPVAAMAERNHVAVLCIMHLNKSQGTNVLYRILGSIGYVGVARTVLFVGEHPTNYQERIIDCVKSNIGQLPEPIAFEIDDERFGWIGETNVRASDILNTQGNPEGASALNDAENFLMEELAYGQRKQGEIMEAAKNANISRRTLERAKGNIKVKSRLIHEMDQRYWVWELPNNPKNAKHKQLALLENDQPSFQSNSTPD